MVDEERIYSRSKIDFYLKDENEDLSNCVLITGFYGLGRVGFISVNHFVNKLDVELIGYMVSEFLPPFLSVKGRHLTLPFEIYKYKKLVFLATYFEPYKYEHRSFTEGIIKWAKEKKMSHAILIGGLDSRLNTDKDIIAKVVYTSKYGRLFEEPNLPFMDTGLYISGPMALILMYAEILNFPAIGVLPYAERARPDPIAASRAVEIINEMLGISCGVDELIREAESIENELQELDDLRDDDDDEFPSKDRGMFM